MRKAKKSVGGGGGGEGEKSTKADGERRDGMGEITFTRVHRFIPGTNPDRAADIRLNNSSIFSLSGLSRSVPGNLGKSLKFCR